jgi:hypothetical protein
MEKMDNIEFYKLSELDEIDLLKRTKTIHDFNTIIIQNNSRIRLHDIKIAKNILVNPNISNLFIIISLNEEIMNCLIDYNHSNLIEIESDQLKKDIICFEKIKIYMEINKFKNLAFLINKELK